jgi:hypothetical protein
VVSVYEEVRERRSHDRRLLARNLLIALNACSSIMLMVAMVWCPASATQKLVPFVTLALDVWYGCRVAVRVGAARVAGFNRLA